MRTIANTEEVDALPDRSVIVLAQRDEDVPELVSTSIFQTHFGTWTEMDPGDRYDGEESVPSSAIPVIAERDGMTITESGSVACLWTAQPGRWAWAKPMSTVRSRRSLQAASLRTTKRVPTGARPRGRP